MTLKSARGMIVEPGLLWVCVVMDCGSHRENLDCSKVAVIGWGEGCPHVLPLSFWDGRTKSVVLFVRMS